MRKVNFLEVIIGHKRIKIEEKKVKTVINWIVSKLVKNFLELANYYRRFVKIFCKNSNVKIVESGLHFLNNQG